MGVYQYRAMRWNVSDSNTLIGLIVNKYTLGRHVARTGDIKQFIVTEESGIAKGIRRIVAITGHDAAEAQRVADSLTNRLNQIDAMAGSQKDAALKSYTVVRPLSMVT